MFEHILLNGLFMVKTRLYQVVEDAQQKFLGVLLFAEMVSGHDLTHKRLYHLGMRSSSLICLADKALVCTKKTSLIFAEFLVTFISNTKLVKWNCMGQTLHDRVEKASIPSILHAETHPFLHDDVLAGHELVNRFVRGLLNCAGEVVLELLSLLALKFKLSTSLWTNRGALRDILLFAREFLERPTLFAED